MVVRRAPDRSVRPRRLLLTWIDRAPVALSHHGARPTSDRGPVLRLLENTPEPYDEVWVITPAESRARAGALAGSLAVAEARVVVVDVDDPSDHAALFRALGDVAQAVPPAASADVLLSAGTPQVQTMWVILVQAGLLPARMLQVIPPEFVPVPHPHPVREVRLDIDGFPTIRALRDEVRRLSQQLGRGFVVGESRAMKALAARIARVAASDLPVVVHGETGTGKEHVARAVHDGSRRAKGPFVAESCGALPEGTLASELFGHEKGAFTSADALRRGVFERANGGTLFLDEVGELPPKVQVHLLRVLEERAVRRVGGEASVPVDVRIVAASHRDLGALVEAGQFREDLYYRLNGARLEVPPLRDRGEDLEPLVEAFLAEVGRPRLAPAEGAWRLLRAYSWPGNVRELRAEVLRWSVFCDARVTAADLSPEIRGERRPPGATSPGRVELQETLAEAVGEAERRAVRAAMARAEGNVSRAARALGIDRNTLKRKLAAMRPAS
jgi:DNA-binding NtrC family response regulator